MRYVPGDLNPKPLLLWAPVGAPAKHLLPLKGFLRNQNWGIERNVPNINNKFKVIFKCIFVTRISRVNYKNNLKRPKYKFVNKFYDCCIVKMVDLFGDNPDLDHACYCITHSIRRLTSCTEVPREGYTMTQEFPYNTNAKIKGKI
jgi:hypothetical protein